MKPQRPQSVTFFGASYRIAQALDRIAPLKQVVCERRQFNRDIYDLSRILDADFSAVERKDDLENISFPDDSFAFSYGFGIIFSPCHIERFPCGIWNIHTGALPEYRSRHPISWALINGENRLGVSIHEINGEIDRGHLLAQTFVERDLHDTESEIVEKMENALVEGLLQQAVDSYFDDRKQPLGSGCYHEQLSHKFKEISPSKYDSRFVFHLFKSQAKHGGVRIDGQQFVECVFYLSEFPEYFDGYRLITCGDGQQLGVK